jgi:hypothetical protein
MATAKLGLIRSAGDVVDNSSVMCFMASHLDMGVDVLGDVLSASLFCPLIRNITAKNTVKDGHNIICNTSIRQYLADFMAIAMNECRTNNIASYAIELRKR